MCTRAWLNLLLLLLLVVVVAVGSGVVAAVMKVLTAVWISCRSWGVKVCVNPA